MARWHKKAELSKLSSSGGNNLEFVSRISKISTLEIGALSFWCIQVVKCSTIILFERSTLLLAFSWWNWCCWRNNPHLAFLWFMPHNFQDLRILKFLGFEDHYILRMLGSRNPKDFRILKYKSSSFIAHDFQDLRILKSLKFQNPQLQIIIITRTYTKILRI